MAQTKFERAVERVRKEEERRKANRIRREAREAQFNQFQPGVTVTLDGADEHYIVTDADIRIMFITIQRVSDGETVSVNKIDRLALAS